MTPEEFADAIGVSHETLERLKKMDAILLDWASRHNLIARSTIEDRWRRHYLDSAQLFPRIPVSARSLVDLGSGAGFPGLVLAAMGAAYGLNVVLLESTGKKAGFLRAAIDAMALDNATVIPERIERARLDPPDIVTARALAPLPKLLDYAHEIQGKNTRCFFHKGQDVEDELTEAAKCWHMEVIPHPSITNPGSVILEVRNLARA
ncbi:MAG: 16S rRNA (guanine(527)-N(7))-methyltransferase RsmG [Parvularculaceae bacterium]